MTASILAGRVAVITGAGSGIGRALAQELAGHGCRLALADVDAQGLEETAAGLTVPHRVWELDVSDRDAVCRFADAVRAHFGTVNIVINNAGVTFMQNVRRSSWADFEWLMGVNFWGVVHGSKAFLPYLQAADSAWLVNISSVFGIIGFPHQAAYNASKFGVRGFTEALRHELAVESPQVCVTCVHPGGIRTNIARNARFYADPEGSTEQARSVARFEEIARTTPEQAAAVIVRGILRRRPRVLIGADARLIDLVQRLLPVSYFRVLGGLFLRRRQAPPDPDARSR